MSTYYKIACDEVRENIDPGGINDLGVKEFAISHPDHPFGAVCVYAMRTRWNGLGCRIVSDSGGDHGYDEYVSVTGQVLAEYNKYYGCDLHLTQT